MRTVLMIIISTIIMSARTALIMVARHNDLLVCRQNHRGKRSARKGGVLAAVTLRALPLPKNRLHRCVLKIVRGRLRTCSRVCVKVNTAMP